MFRNTPNPNAAKVLVLTVHAEERYLLPVLQAGGSGYVRKSSAHTDLLNAIRTVARGEVFLDPGATKTLLRGYLGRSGEGEEIDIVEVLSEREREVVKLTAEGYTAQQSADFLSLSPKTVETYRHRAMQKLGDIGARLVGTNRSPCNRSIEAGARLSENPA